MTFQMVIYLYFPFYGITAYTPRKKNNWKTMIKYNDKSGYHGIRGPQTMPKSSKPPV